jgi:predicted RNase H-like nuclease (RuvC/YqgF family)
MDPLTGLLTAIATATAGFFAYLRTKKGKTAVFTYFKRIINVDPSSDDLRAALDNLSLVVDTQGVSIEWLTGQLTSYREQLAEAQEKLKDMENIHQENKGLRVRIADLEAQVAALEAELARRKKFTPKDKRTDSE